MRVKFPGRNPPMSVQWGVAKPNYHQARRQKELIRKARQQEKQQKRAASKAAEEPAAPVEGDSAVTNPGESGSAPIAETGA